MRSPSVALVRCASAAFNVLFISLVTRFAGLESAGSFFAFYAAVLIVSSVSRLGTEQYLVSHLPRLTAAEKPGRITAMLAALTVTTFVLALLSAGLWAVDGLRTLFPGAWGAFLLFWLATFALSLNWASVGTLRGLGRYLESVSLETLIYLGIFVSALIALQLLRATASTDLMILLGGSIGASCLIGWGLVSWRVRSLPLPEPAMITRIVKESRIFWLASSLGVANAWMPILLLKYFSTSEEVSVFTLSYRVAALLLFGLMILNARYSFDYARLMSAGAVSELTALYRRNTYSQIPFVVVAAIGLGLLAPYLFEFSKITHEHAYLILIFLVLGIFANAVCGPIVTASVTTGNADIVSSTLALTVTLSVLIVIALGRHLDGLLLAQIVSVTIAVQNFTMYFWWTRRMQSKIRE